MSHGHEFSSSSFNPNAIELAGSLQGTLNSVETSDFTLEMQQNEAIEAIGIALVNGQTSGYLEMATSTGKTAIEALVAQAAVKANKRALILCPKINIARQISGLNHDKESGLAKFTDLHEQTRVGHHFGGKLASARDQVVISTYSSFLNDAQNDHARLGEFDVVIGDECHRSLGEKTAQAMSNSFPNAIKLGFSATPDFAVDRTSEEIFGDRIYEFSLIEAIESGKTAPIRTLVYETQEELELTDNKAEFTDKELAPFIENMQRNGTALQLAQDLIRDRRQGIIRCIPGNTNLHARMMAAQLSKINGIRAAAIGSHLSHDDQQLLLQLFDKGKIDCLTSTRAIEEGWDSDKASFCINMAPTSSPVSTKQLMGRILRKRSDPKESIYIDFVDRNSGVAKQQYTALHALGLETVDSKRILGRQTSRDDEGFNKTPLTLPQISDELLRRILASNGKLINEITITKKNSSDPLINYWERVLTKEGFPGDLPDNIAFDAVLDKKYKLGQKAAARTLERVPTPQEVAENIKTLNKDQRRMLAHYGLQLSLDDAEDEVAQISDDFRIDEAFIEEEKRDGIHRLLRSLYYRQEDVLRLRYGFAEDEQLTFDEIGHKLGVTRARAAQLEKRALDDIRKKIGQARVNAQPKLEPKLEPKPKPLGEFGPYTETYNTYRVRADEKYSAEYTSRGHEHLLGLSSDAVQDLFTISGLPFPKESGLTDDRYINIPRVLFPYFEKRLQASSGDNYAKYHSALLLLKKLHRFRNGATLFRP